MNGIHLVDEGDGPPLVLLHGNPDTADVWRDILPHLRKRRCLAPDLPGFGRSAAGRSFALEELARFVLSLLDDLGIAQADLVVHDAGGFWGLAAAARHPERVRRLVVLNTVFFADYRYHFWARVCRTPLLGELSMALLNFPLYRWEMRRGSKLPERYIEESYRLITPRMQKEVLRMYRALPPSAFAGWSDELQSRKLPTLVLWGDRDPYVLPSFAERFGGEVRHFDAGHWLQVERPLEVAAAIDQFLTAPG